MERHSLALRLVFALIVLLLSSLPGQAQTATVGGMIVDASGAVVSGASITAQNTETGISRDAASNDAGLFRFSNLPPGPYTINIEKPGFQTIHIPDLVLTVNQAFTFEATLQVAAAATTVEVKASELPLIDLETAQISNLVDSKRITDLPLLTRDPYSLILLSPGVIESNSSNGGFSVNGTSERNNNFVLDGADNNDTDVPGVPYGINSLNPDSTQEFRVITNSFAPEYGRNDGALIEVITRSGSNEFHGDAYWFGRYNALGARDYFNPAALGPQNPYVRNDFGGSAGGRIIKDRTFWFANYEGQRFITTLTNESTVPTSDFASGNFNVLGQQIDLQSPNSGQNATGYSLDPTIQKILGLYTKYTPNGPPVIPGVSGTLFFPSTSRLTSDVFTIKLDHNLSKKHVLMGRYAFNQSNDPNNSHTDFLPGGLGATGFYQRAQNGVIGLTSTLSERFVNEFRFAANRNDVNFNCNGVSTFDSFGRVDTFGRGADYNMPFSSSGFGCQALFDSDSQARFTGTYQTIDNMSLQKGHQLFKWGVEFRDVYSNSYDNFNTRAQLDFSAYSNTGAQFLNLPANSPLLATDSSGNYLYPDQLAAAEDGASLLFGYADNQVLTQYFDHAGNRVAGDARGLRQREWAGYGQDTWKATSNLSVTYGLRWEYFGVPFEANNNLSTLYADPSAAAQSFTFSIVGPGTGNLLYKNQFNNFEPRVGLAWDPFKKGKTSVRAAYGIYHDRIFGNLVGNLRDNPPFAQSSPFASADILPNIPTPATVSTSPVLDEGAQFAATLIDPNFKTPYSQNWNFGVQHAITPTVTIEVNYVGVKGDRLYRVVDGNPPQPALVASLLQFCTPTNPANATFGCSSSTLQFYNLWTGYENGYLPYDAANNNAFVYYGYPGAVLIKSIGGSIYHGMQVNLQKHFSNGFQIQGAYTFSHAIDNVNDPIAPAQGNGSFPFNSFDLQAERGNSDYDIRHRGVVNFIYEPNIGRGRGHLSSGFLGRALEGWSLTGIVQAQTGHPYDIYDTSQDSDHTGLPARGTIIGPTAQPAGTDKTFTGPTNIVTTPLDAQPNIGKNQFYGPNLVNMDTAVLKTTSINEKLKLQFRLEAFNLFNHTQFSQPVNNIAEGSAFGESLSTLTRPDGTTSARQLQVALKLMF